MSEGIVSFFEYTHFGFYKKGSDYQEPLNLYEVLESMYDWYQERSSVADTLLWSEDQPGYTNRKKVYLKSIDFNEETGDYIVILWRAVGSGDGVYGIPANAELTDNRLYDANDATDEEVIWGEPAYYWFAPSRRIFASIKFRKSITDTKMMNRFLKDYIELQSDIKQKHSEVKEGKQGTYTSIFFDSEDTDHSDNLWLRIYSKQCVKLTSQADLGLIARDITHFVKREVISSRVPQRQDWTRYFRGLPFISSESTRDDRKIEVLIEASPTREELREIFETYTEEYSIRDKWTNLGFIKNGVGGVCWLNKFVIRNTLNVSDIAQDDDSGHYTTDRLFRALHLTRENLLAPFPEVEGQNQEDDIAFG